MVRQDRLREAHQLMEAHRDEVPTDAMEYWTMFGNIAWELAESKSA